MIVCFLRSISSFDHADKRPIHVNIFKTRHLVIKAGTEFEKSGDFSVNLDSTADPG